jgi:beta-L-arabinofuranosidase (glycosyl hydrolase family 127)/glycosyl hydrolase family 127 (putative beta-L-arabinofuranosidase)
MDHTNGVPPQAAGHVPTAGAGLDRRQFLVRGGAVAGGAVIATGLAPAAAGAQVRRAGGVRTVSRAPAVRGGWYRPNRAPLAPTAFSKLPPGSVTPGGWVRGQLDLQRNGLNGRMYEISDYLVYDNCGWVDSTKWAWEELPYWLRGFSDLGIVTGDGRIQDLAHRWVDGILANQQSDGWFGPQAMRTSLNGGPDFWPSMPLMDMLRSHADATGDARVVPFMTAFFGFMSQQQDSVFGLSWASYRWGDEIDSIYWLYNQTGDNSLLDLVDRIHQNSANYVDNIPTWHNVNLAQGIREPAEYGLLAGDPKYQQATYQDYATVMNTYGQFSGGGFAADENARPGFYDPRQGFETCGIVELMRTCEMLTRITGDPVWTDRCEELAFNMLPAAFDPDQLGTHYLTCANSVYLGNADTSPDFDDGGPRQAYRPGIHVYRCCPHNYSQGWPYYSEEMWLATPDGGLCASMYGQSQVRAKAGSAGAAVTITEDTGYPFADTVTLTVRCPGTLSFPLWLRIPGWCPNASVRVNQQPVAGGPAGSYVVLDQDWSNGDTVSLRLPMTTTTQSWPANHGSVSVRRGPLAYSLAIGENYAGYPSGSGNFVTDPAWPHHEVHPGTDWNYGLDLDPADAAQVIDVIGKAGPVPANPFTQADVPISLRAPVRKIPNWQVDDKNVVRHLQPSPARSAEPARRATLIPMGAARLRITSFPLIGANGQGHEWEAPSASTVWTGDLLDAVNDGLEPQSSYDQNMPRLTFWSDVSTAEWVQYDYARPITTSSAAVYWYDDTGHGSTRVPQSWQLLYLDNGRWTPVPGASAYGTDVNSWNTVTFGQVQTTAVRMNVLLQPNYSAGILEWKVDQA